MTDRDSFTAWAQARQLALLRSATLLTGDRHRAEDLVQEALTAVALRWDRLAAGYPDAYARQVMVRTNISWWRRTRREVVAEPADRASPRPEPDRRMILDDALRQLTPKQRAVVVLRYYDDLTVAQAAGVMGIHVGTVKSQTHAALRRLREAAPELAELLKEDS